jgi:DNA-binding CsgD family transcriptional regulator
VQIIDPEILVPIVTRFVDREGLTPAERAEVLRLAQGFACKESAAAAEISPETIRARRKRIYRKLDVGGVVAGLLGRTLALLVSGEPFGAPRLAAAGGPSGLRLAGDAETV